MPSSRYTVFLQSMLLGAILTVAGCQTAPPVQEISDARQAIAAAEEAGAAEHAPADLEAAIGYLSSAEQSISAKRYAEARRDAMQAKSMAFTAIRRSEREKEKEP